MNLIKSTLITAFTATALLCVSYAHSQTTEGKIYRTSAYLVGNCMIRVMKDGDATVFKVNSYSGTAFRAVIPAGTSEAEIPSPAAGEPADPYRGRELLTVRYTLTDTGEVIPVSYRYENSRGSEHSCQALVDESPASRTARD